MSKFDAIKRASKARETKPGATIKRDEDPEEKPKPKRGRPKGKRSDDNFQQVTAYVRRDTYKATQKALVDEEQEFSELVEDLLVKWLKSRT